MNRKIRVLGPCRLLELKRFTVCWREVIACSPVVFGHLGLTSRSAPAELHIFVGRRN